MLDNDSLGTSWPFLELIFPGANYLEGFRKTPAIYIANSPENDRRGRVTIRLQGREINSFCGYSDNAL